MTFIEQFVASNFMKLPPRARVVAYFVFLFLFVYLVVSPRFVNGDVVALKDGQVLPYRGVEIKTAIEGRTLKFRTNEDGVWSVPLISRFPADLRVAVKHVDTDGWLEIVIPATDIWAAWSPNFRIKIDGTPPQAEMEIVQAPAWNPMAGLITRFLGLSTALAGELQLPRGTTASDPLLKQRIAQTVNSAVASALKQPSAGELRDLPFSGPGAPSYIDRIVIIRKLERGYKLLIPDEHWQSLKSADELAEYVYRRKLLEQSNPERYQVKQSYDWTRIETNPSSVARPKFSTMK